MVDAAEDVGDPKFQIGLADGKHCGFFWDNEGLLPIGSMLVCECPSAHSTRKSTSTKLSTTPGKATVSPANPFSPQSNVQRLTREAGVAAILLG